jgi:hypothetical protein
MPPRLEEDDTHKAILENFTLDEEDEEQLSNEPSFDPDGDDNDEPDAGDEAPPARKPATEPVADEDDRNDRFAFKEDRQGNFIDKDGNVIVRRGKPRDIFVKIKKAYLREQNKSTKIAQEFQTTVAAARELLTRYNELKEKKNYFEAVGLNEDEAKQAADIGALVKLDPKAAVRKILTLLHLNGTDLSDIGVTGPVDAKEVARHMLEMQQARQPKEKSEEDKVREEVQGFLTRHPTARQYSGILAQAKQRFPQMTYDELWFQLLTHAKKPQQQQPAPANNRPFPRNSQRTPTGPVAGKLSLKAVDPSQSFSQIGRDLLRDLQQLEKG